MYIHTISNKNVLKKLATKKHFVKLATKYCYYYNLFLKFFGILDFSQKSQKYQQQKITKNSTAV